MFILGWDGFGVVRIGSRLRYCLLAFPVQVGLGRFVQNDLGFIALADLYTKSEWRFENDLQSRLLPGQKVGGAL